MNWIPHTEEDVLSQHTYKAYVESYLPIFQESSWRVHSQRSACYIFSFTCSTYSECVASLISWQVIFFLCSPYSLKLSHLSTHSSIFYLLIFNRETQNYFASLEIYHFPTNCDFVILYRNPVTHRRWMIMKMLSSQHGMLKMQSVCLTLLSSVALQTCTQVLQIFFINLSIRRNGEMAVQYSRV